MTPAEIDGLLQEWGTRLFFGMPKKAKRGDSPSFPLLPASTVRVRIRAAVRPSAKQVMVKITGGGRGMKAVSAHFRYISRLGQPEVGGKGKSLELEDENGETVTGRDGLEGLRYDWQRAGSYIAEESHRREAFNLVLSMPSGTPADQVRDAASAFARETFNGHKYVFALHDDTDSPHVHLVVRAERMDGVRLNPRKADLQRWRERFAACLQDRGIDAIATRAAMRGVVRAPQQLWRIQAAKAGRERQPRSQARNRSSLRGARKQAATAWAQVADALARSSDARDRELAKAVVAHAGWDKGTEVPERAVAQEHPAPGVGPQAPISTEMRSSQRQTRLDKGDGLDHDR